MKRPNVPGAEDGARRARCGSGMVESTISQTECVTLRLQELRHAFVQNTASSRT